MYPTDGTFYIYANVCRFTNDNLGLARRPFIEAGVAVTPGIDFDTARGAGYLRFSFAGTREDMTGAMDRVGHWLR